ncbi:MAG: transcriptional repressor [Deltaproteobacteria bacterium]|nr:transcriptional repressor [Deltaproteobacteria bacterium]
MRNARRRLRGSGKGSRNSIPRQQVLEFLEKNKTEHFSAAKIFEALIVGGKQIGIASVYRNLELLSSLGVIRKVNLGSGEAVYQYADEKRCHWHLVWPDKVDDIEPDNELVEMLDAVRDSLSKKYGVDVKDTVLNFFVDLKEDD